MRLSKKDIAAIENGINESPFVPQCYEIYLFGSRADNKKLGGDIDLMMIVDDSELESLETLRHRLTTAASKYLDDQKWI